MCFLSTLAFLLSAGALSLLWRKRDLGCLIRSLTHIAAARSLMYAEPLLE